MFDHALKPWQFYLKTTADSQLTGEGNFSALLITGMMKAPQRWRILGEKDNFKSPPAPPTDGGSWGED